VLTITTIYFAHLETLRDPVTGKIIKKELSDVENADRKVVVVYAGSSRMAPDEI
jgi:hypothetical protein